VEKITETGLILDAFESALRKRGVWVMGTQKARDDELVVDMPR